MTTSEQLVLVLTIPDLSLAAVTSGALRITEDRANARLSFRTGSDISMEILRRTLFQPYSVHLDRNSSAVVSSIVGNSKVTSQVIFQILTLIGSTVLMIAILSILLTLNTTVTLIAIAGFGL